MSHRTLHYCVKEKESVLKSRQIKEKQLRNDSPGTHMQLYCRSISYLMIEQAWVQSSPESSDVYVYLLRTYVRDSADSQMASGDL